MGKVEYKNKKVVFILNNGKLDNDDDDSDDDVKTGR